MYNVNIQLNYKKIKITHCGRHNPKIAPVAPLQDSPGSGVHVLSPGDSNTHLGIAVKRFCKYRYGSKSVSLKTGRVLVGLNLLKTRFSLAVRYEVRGLKHVKNIRCHCCLEDGRNHVAKNAGNF